MAVAKTITGAHYGLRDWLAQRITALIIIVYTLALGIVLLTAGPLDYLTWTGVFGSQWMKVLTLMAFLSVAWHAWVGVRDIYMDYIKPTSIRLLLQVLTIMALAGYSLWCLMILWRV